MGLYSLIFILIEADEKRQTLLLREIANITIKTRKLLYVSLSYLHLQKTIIYIFFSINKWKILILGIKILFNDND